MIAMLAAAALIGQSDTTFGSWIYRETVDPITDQKRAVAAILTDDGTLAVKCDESGVGSVYVSYSGLQYFGAGRSTVNRRPVVFRFPGSEPRQMLWLYSDDDYVLMVDNVSAFTKPLLSATSVSIRAMTHRFEDVTRTFDTTGSYDAVTKVYWACGDVLPN